MGICTNKQLAECFQKMLAQKWGYVWGAQGELYTQALAEQWRDDKSRGVPSSKWRKETYYTEDCAKWFGHRVADCSGSFVAAFRTYNHDYADRTANTIYEQATERGGIKKIPEIIGLAVWRKGHIGLYIGGGYVIEARGTNYGVVKTKLADRDFTHWLKVRDVEYIEEPKTTDVELPILRQGDKGDSVKSLQSLLKMHKCLDEREKTDGIFGKNTKAAVIEFQHFYGLTEDGIVGGKTWDKIIKG